MKKILILFFLLSFNISIGQVKYQLYVEEELILKSRELLIQQIGVKEKTGKNDGPKIKEYLKSVNLDEGAAWCQSLQYWCYYMAQKLTGLVNAILPIPKSGVANNTFVYAQKNGKKVKYEAEDNDFIIWRLQSSTWQGHIGRIIEVKKAGWVITVEGNTSNGLSGSQREGNVCARREQNIYHPLGRMNVRGLVGVSPIKKMSVKVPNKEEEKVIIRSFF